MLYYLHTLPGLGALAWQEATGRVFDPSKAATPRQRTIWFVPGKNDLVLLRSRKEPRDLLRLRVSEDVFALAVRGYNISPESQGIRQIYAAVSRSDMVGDAVSAWSQAAKTRRLPATFRVVTREIGPHHYRRREIGQAVADAIKAKWPGRWRQVDEAADVEVWVNLFERDLLCGVRLSPPEMRQRRGTGASSAEWRHLPAALRPALAAAMVMLTNPAQEDVFLDPMAGSGTLAAERAAVEKFRTIYAGDNERAPYETLQENLGTLPGDIRCERWDARKLPLADQSVDAAAVNLPFGKQVAAADTLPALYQGVLAELQRVLRPDGRLVVLVGDGAMLESARKAAASQLVPNARHRIRVLGQAAMMVSFTRAGQARSR